MKIVPIEWVVSASVLFVIVLVLRGLLGKRISAELRYGLWSVVLVRLLLPVSLFMVMTVPQLPTWTPPPARTHYAAGRFRGTGDGGRFAG